MSYALIQLAITRIPKSPGWEPVPVLVRKWAAQQKVNSWWGWRVKLYLPLPIAHLTPEPPHPLPHSWKNCLLGNQFLMPKRLGTAGLYGLAFSSLNARQKGKHDDRLTLYFPVIGSIYKDLL